MTSTRQRLALAAALVVVAASLGARAQEDSRQLFERGRGLFALHKFAEAAAVFEKAFEGHPDPAILYNAAQAHRLANNKARALTLYESLLNLYGHQIDNRPEIVEHIRQLRIAIETEQRAAQAPPPTIKTPPPTLASASAQKAEADRAAAQKAAADRAAAQKAAADRAAADKAAAQRAAAQRAAEERAAARKAAEERAVAEKVEAARRQAAREAKRQADEKARAERDVDWARQRPRRLKVSGIAVAAIGLGCLVAGAAFTALASSANDRFLHPANGTYSASAEQDRSLYQSLDIGAFAIGGAAVATGAALYVLGHHESQTWSLSRAGSSAAPLAVELRY